MLLIEVVGYNPRVGNVVDVLYPVGKAVLVEPNSPALRLRRIDNVTELFDEEDDEWPDPLRQVPLVIRGQQVHVDAPQDIEEEELFRMLVPQHRELSLADETELRRVVPADLPEVLRLDEWHHETVIRGGSGPPSAAAGVLQVAPSDVEAYQQIAKVLATGDASRYRPTLPPNTHWSDWPQSGRL
ncbi:hypothetical protein [Micromonospora sp. KC606]|uniref:DUF7003 family protein n=1 Tax=Micromonospora sp. KC606 TaxID=2530379 RepID=UPI001FB58487|nr:hypothetical protein [Micromonospora sp. KC606]